MHRFWISCRSAQRSRYIVEVATPRTAAAQEEFAPVDSEQNSTGIYNFGCLCMCPALPLHVFLIWRLCPTHTRMRYGSTNVSSDCAKVSTREMQLQEGDAPSPMTILRPVQDPQTFNDSL